MRITFLGTGTSQGVPVPACKCDVCTMGKEHDKRLRSSILVETDNEIFCIDAGPDFRYQMLRAGVEKLDGIIITHSHRDHIAGLDDVRSYNYLQKKAMNIYASNYDQQEIKTEFSYAFNSDYPGLPQYNMIPINDNPFMLGKTKIIPIPVLHYRTEVYGFRIGDFVYITDANYIPPKSLMKMRNCDTLVINALRKEKHISHFNLAEALKIIEFVAPKRAYLTHISHLMGFAHILQNELPENVFPAYDKLVIECD